jgi:glycosyltransferase involved in cell wall biosynthesis
MYQNRRSEPDKIKRKMEQHFVSVIIPCFNEEKHIAECLESVIRQDYSNDQMEVLIMDGMSTDNTREIVLEYAGRYPFIKMSDNPCRAVSFALNQGISHSIGDVIIRMDAHSRFPSNYLSVLVRNLFDFNADNVGGVWKTLPGTDSLMCQAIAVSSSHKFGVGNSLHKTGVKQLVQTDTVPYGCFRRELFDRIGMFDEDLIRNQDDEFNARIINNGGKIFIIPDVIIEYFARTTLVKTAKMFYQYGLFKPLVNKKLGAPATFRQFFPPLFVSALIAGPVISLYFPLLQLFFLGGIALYLSVSFGLSFTSALRNRKPGLFFLLPLTFFTIHFSYGVGYLAGLIKFSILNHVRLKNKIQQIECIPNQL